MPVHADDLFAPGRTRSLASDQAHFVAVADIYLALRRAAQAGTQPDTQEPQS